MADPAVFGLSFSPLAMDQLVEQIVAAPLAAGQGIRAIYTANVDHVARLHRDAEFRAAYDQAWAVTADGAPVYVYARLRGSHLPSRVTGSGLVVGVMAGLEPGRHRCFFAPSSAETAKLIRERLLARGFDDDSIEIVVPPFGFERDAAYSAALAERIRQHGTTHLFLGVGAPKSEIWLSRYRADLGDCYALCAGAGLDMLVGTKRRAPALLQRVGFEWLWRLALEPRRLFRRYFIDSWTFVSAIHSDLRHLRPRT